MEILDLVQGSAEWHATRLQHCTASEAPVMMGDSSKGKRNELLALKKTGEAKAVSDYVQKNVFDPGHEMEAAQRLLVEEDIGEELYPTTARVVTDGIPLLASVDGQTMDGSILFEHKGWNEPLAAMVRSGELTAEYYWQLEQQLHIFGAEKVLFVVSDGTRENREQLEYRAVPGRFAQLLGSWAQFLDDLQAFEVKAPEQKIEPRSIENLPALVIKLSGGVAQSNLAEYTAGAMKFIEGIKTDLQTDQDFVDAKATVAFCEQAEKAIKDIKKKALEDTESIKVTFEAMDKLAEAMRQKRLSLDKQVKTQEASIKQNIQLTAENAFREHVAAINKEIGPRVRLPDIECDVAGAMSGKRKLDSLRDAADTTVANAKIKANELATVIRLNLAVLRELDAKYRGLFTDVQDIILKGADDFANLVTLRVKDADEKEAEAERKRIADEDRIREEGRQQALADAKAKKEAEEKKAADEKALKEKEEREKANPAPVATSAPVEELAAEPKAAPAVGPGKAVTQPTAPAQMIRQPATAQPEKRKVVAQLISLESLILAVLDGVAPENLLLVNEQAVAEFVAEKGFAPPGFNLASVE